jgi:mono/diheme cytochrome c family protein
VLINLLGWAILAAAVVLFGLLTWRAWHIRQAIFKWPAVVLGSLLTRLLAIVAGMAGRGLYLLYAPHPVAAIDLTVERTPERVTRGQHLAAVACAACHSSSGDLPLSGGENLAKQFPLPLGNIYPPNLTPGGPVASLSDGDIWRIIRYGVLPNGRQSLFMPVQRLRNLSDEDLKSVIVYLRRLPPAPAQ